MRVQSVMRFLSIGYFITLFYTYTTEQNSSVTGTRVTIKKNKRLLDQLTETTVLKDLMNNCIVYTFIPMLSTICLVRLMNCLKEKD